MLSLGKLAPGGQQYYLDTVAAGVEDYYTGSGEAPGEWIGLGADRLGLDGRVDAADLHAVLDAHHPATGERLTRAQGAAKIPGFDATFTAPKSVSLLFALGSPDISRQVRQAHEVAVARALEVLEHEAARARRGKAGLQQVAADGFVAAGFRHRTSRAGDPHLHTHVLIANLVHAPGDDRWSALDARPLYGWAKTAGYLYESQLRAELTRRLGVEFEPVSKGIADIAGFGRPVLREFSQRRQQIEAHLVEHGQTSAKAAQVATYATRQAKDGTPMEVLVQDWHIRARRLGLDQVAVDGVCDRTRRQPPAVGDTEQLFLHLAGPTGLTEHNATFNRRDVIQAVCDAMPAGADIDQIIATSEDFLRQPDVVRLNAFDDQLIHRQDGSVAPAPSDEIRFTSLDMLAAEGRFLRSAMERQDERVGIASDAAVDRALRARPTMSAEQRDMVLEICQDGLGVDLVQGVAGAGKTFALAAAHQAWSESGHSVTGVAVAARAAQQLQEGSGVPSCTIDRLLVDADRHGGLRLPDRHVLVVDEAGMVGTRKLVRLLDLAEQSGTKVVLVGDPWQLPEIEAGGAFSGLGERVEGSELRENRRQVEPWEREALAELRDGDTDRALDAYDRHGRVHRAASVDEALDMIVDCWLDARDQGNHSLIMADRRSQADQINHRARAALQQRGEVGPDLLGIGDDCYAIGDTVMALRNDRGLGLLNGNRGTITDIDFDRRRVTVELKGRTPIQVPFLYLTAGNLTHGYAMTVHKAQGATDGQGMLLADETITREHAYTGMSRGVFRNDIFLVVDDLRAEERHVAETLTDPDQAIRAGIRRSGAKTMAIEDLAEPPVPERRPEPPEIDRGIDLF